MPGTPIETTLTKPVSVRMREDDLDALDRLAGETRQKRSALIVEGIRCRLLMSDYSLDYEHLELLLDEQLDMRLTEMLNELRQILVSLDEARAGIRALL